MKNKKGLLLVSLISFLMILSITQETYSKYMTEADGEAETNIARWNIKVNSQDIISNDQLNNVLTPIFSSNPHVLDGVIAPGAIGYFDLDLDGSNVDVSFSYTINTLVSSSSDVSSLIVVGYTIDGGAMNTMSGMIVDLSGDILVDAVPKTKNIRLYVKWDESISNNFDDTSAAIANGKAKMDVFINFSQIVD